jgi:hypothetical protein
MAALKMARRAGFTPERATRIFLVMLAAVLAVVLLLAAESTGEVSAGAPEGDTLLVELVANGLAQGNSTGGTGDVGTASPQGATTNLPVVSNPAELVCPVVGPDDTVCRLMSPG